MSAFCAPSRVGASARASPLPHRPAQMTETSCRAVHDPARVLGSRSLQCGREKDRLANGRHVIIRSAPSFLYTNVCYCEHLHVSARLGRPSGHMVQTTAECIAVQIADVRLSVRPVELLLGKLQGSRRCGDPFPRTSACSEEAPASEGKGGRDRSRKMQELRPRSAPILTVCACRAFEGRPSEELQHPAADAERHSTLVLPAS